jgi:hypothetical protein
VEKSNVARVAEERLDLSHFTDEPLVTLRSVEQPTKDYRSEFDKPKGLWVSVDGDDDWASWCAGSDFDIGQKRYNVILKPEANILLIKSASALMDFTYDYGVEREDGYRRRYIPWEIVAAKYQGIIIAPYQWGCRMHEETRWYYGWDCASGCIWDSAAIANTSEAREREVA